MNPLFYEVAKTKYPTFKHTHTSGWLWPQKVLSAQGTPLTILTGVAEAWWKNHLFPSPWKEERGMEKGKGI